MMNLLRPGISLEEMQSEIKRLMIEGLDIKHMQIAIVCWLKNGEKRKQLTLEDAIVFCMLQMELRMNEATIGGV